jgi:hypothetical protein
VVLFCCTLAFTGLRTSFLKIRMSQAGKTAAYLSQICESKAHESRRMSSEGGVSVDGKIYDHVILLPANHHGNIEVNLDRGESGDFTAL